MQKQKVNCTSGYTTASRLGFQIRRTEKSNLPMLQKNTQHGTFFLNALYWCPI
jgi:hypothetical protein